MSVFASHTQATIAIPHDPPQTVTIQKLSRKQLLEAGRNTELPSIADVRASVGLPFLEALSEQGANKALLDIFERDPLLLYDVSTLLRLGVKAWTYDMPCTPESFDDLDDETATFIAREVLRLTAPRLFQTEEQAEEARKNDSSPSTLP